MRGVQTFFSEGRIQENKPRAGPHISGDILCDGHMVEALTCILYHWVQGIKYIRETKTVKYCDLFPIFIKGNVRKNNKNCINIIVSV